MHKTLQRKEILEVLRNSEKHFTAYDVHNILITRVPQISLGTVYRNLEQLSACGMIRKVKSLTAQKHFERDLSMHFHLYCPSCGKLENISGLEHLDAELQQVIKKLHCETYHLEFLSICPECRKKAAKAEKYAKKTVKKPLSLI